MWHVPRAPLFDVNVFTLMALVIVLQVHLVSLDLGGGSHGWVTWLGHMVDPTQPCELGPVLHCFLAYNI